MADHSESSAMSDIIEDAVAQVTDTVNADKDENTMDVWLSNPYGVQVTIIFTVTMKYFVSFTLEIWLYTYTIHGFVWLL